MSAALPFRTELRASSYLSVGRPALSFHPAWDEFARIDGSSDPSWSELRRWALHPVESVVLRLLQRLGELEANHDQQRAKLTVNVVFRQGADGEFEVLDRTPPAPTEPAAIQHRDRLAYLLYARAMTDAQHEGALWTPVLDALVHTRWAHSLTSLGEDARLECGPPVWAGIHIQGLKPWIESQSSAAALRGLLEFRYREIPKLLGEAMVVWDDAIVRRVLEVSGGPAALSRNASLSSRADRVLWDWAMAALRTPTPNAGVQVFASAPLQQGGDLGEAATALRTLIGEGRVTPSDGDVSSLLAIMAADEPPASGEEVAGGRWAEVAGVILEHRTLAPAYLLRLLEIIGRDESWRRRIRRHPAADADVKLLADVMTDAAARRAREAKDERIRAHRAGTGTLSLALNPETAAAIAEDPATPEERFGLAVRLLVREYASDDRSRELFDAVEKALVDPRLANPSNLSALATEVAELLDSSDEPASIDWEPETLAALCRSVPVRQVVALEPLLSRKIRWLGTEILSSLGRRAGAYRRAHGRRGQAHADALIRLTERLLVGCGRYEGQLDRYATEEVLRVAIGITPSFSEPIFRLIRGRFLVDPGTIPREERPHVSLLIGFLRWCDDLPATHRRMILDEGVVAFDVGLSYNASLTESERDELYARYDNADGRQSGLLRRVVPPTRGIAERALEAKDAEVLRGLARKLSLLPESARIPVAREALALILADPQESDANAAGEIYEVLGDPAGEALVRTKVDALACEVAGLWQLTVDRTWEALASYPRMEARSLLLPAGPLQGGTYAFTPEQAEAVQSVIGPRLLKDRSADVRKDAECALGHLSGEPVDWSELDEFERRRRPFRAVAIETSLDDQVPQIPAVDDGMDLRHGWGGSSGPAVTGPAQAEALTRQTDDDGRPLTLEAFIGVFPWASFQQRGTHIVPRAALLTRDDIVISRNTRRPEEWFAKLTGAGIVPHDSSPAAVYTGERVLRQLVRA